VLPTLSHAILARSVSEVLTQRLQRPAISLALAVRIYGTTHRVGNIPAPLIASGSTTDHVPCRQTKIPVLCMESAMDIPEFR
jgi:hypothetical protein